MDVETASALERIIERVDALDTSLSGKIVAFRDDLREGRSPHSATGWTRRSAACATRSARFARRRIRDSPRFAGKRTRKSRRFARRRIRISALRRGNASGSSPCFMKAWAEVRRHAIILNESTARTSASWPRPWPAFPSIDSVSDNRSALRLAALHCPGFDSPMTRRFSRTVIAAIDSCKNPRRPRRRAVRPSVHRHLAGRRRRPRVRAVVEAAGRRLVSHFPRRPTRCDSSRRADDPCSRHPRVRSDGIRDAVEAAYAAKYPTPGSAKYVRGFRAGRRRDTTVEFVPR